MLEACSSTEEQYYPVTVIDQFITNPASNLLELFLEKMTFLGLASLQVWCLPKKDVAATLHLAIESCLPAQTQALRDFQVAATCVKLRPITNARSGKIRQMYGCNGSDCVLGRTLKIPNMKEIRVPWHRHFLPLKSVCVPWLT